MTDLDKLESQSKIKIFRHVQETFALLSNKSIIINDEIISINEKIYDIGLFYLKLTASFLYNKKAVNFK